MNQLAWRAPFHALVLFFAAVPTLAYPFEEEACARLIGGCLTRPTFGRDVCFQSASASPTCVGSRLGDLVSKRAQFSPLIPEGDDGGPGFLGPQTVDRPCLDRFDMLLGITLDLGPLTSDRLRSLTTQLEACTQTAPPELYRP